MTNQEARGDHSPEQLTPTSIVNLLEDDDGPHTPEDAATQENKERVEENERSCRERRAVLVGVREIGYDHQKEKRNSAAP